jgi:phosphopantothenoylcysteine decarboxylase/phosphopantothenate--cysteine ligase
MKSIKGNAVVLAVTGSIAAYKAVELASQIVQQGANVRVIMTESATHFVTPLTFKAITNYPVSTNIWESAKDYSIQHVSLAEFADAIIVAPATASIIAHIRAGLADNIISSTILATKVPVILAPSMNVNMYENATTQENIGVLKDRGFIIVEPETGRLASGIRGSGRLAKIETIIGTLKHVLARKGPLKGKTIVVTAGGSRESLDPVRFVGNRSSGKMGTYLAWAARDRGAFVKLLTCSEPPHDAVGIEIIRAESALDMKSAVESAVVDADVLIMAAAIADFTPAIPFTKKIKKEGGEINIKFVNTPDILKEVSGDFIRIGFAAETENLIENAKSKLKRKKLDLIAANDITDPKVGFGSEDTKITLIDKRGKIEESPIMTKKAMAEIILDKITKMVRQ